MKPIALISLFTGLAAAIAIIVLKFKAIAKSGGKAEKRDRTILITLSIFAVVLIANIIITFLYF